MDFTKLSKVESPAPRLAATGLKGPTAVIVKVKRKGYRPAGVKVRAEISGDMFTADLTELEIAKLEKDPGIAAISLPRTVQAQVP
jgi:hypothetical protein